MLKHLAKKVPGVWLTMALGLGCCLLGLSESTAQPTAQPREDTAYANRVVAFLKNNEVVTRQDLGEYLIARVGGSKLDNMLKRRLIDLAAQEVDVKVTDAEVQAAFEDSMQGLPREQFIREVIKNHFGLNIYEWKEDRLKPKLLLTKICRAKLKVTEEDLSRAFERTFGERVLVRMIIWPPAKSQEVQGIYGQLRESDDFFTETARKQVRSDLASTAGRIKPIGRHSLDEPQVEKTIFGLKPGDVSELMSTKDGIMVVKCDRRIPPDTTASLESKRAELTQQVIDLKLQAEVPLKMKELDARAKPRKAEVNWTVRGEAKQPVAWLGEGVPVTREEYGEYLIARYGTEKLEMLVNMRIIDQASKARNITVSKEEIEAALKKHIEKYKATPEVFERQVLKPAGSTLFEFREDFLRPELLMTKMVRGQVKPTEAEIKQAFNAYHGERVECRMILYPRGEEKVAMHEYKLLQDSEEAFARKAKNQASPRLAAFGGKMPPIGRNTTGNEELEKEIFSLKEGDVSRLVGAPEGTVLVKLDRRIPADANASLEKERERLTLEVMERKMRVQIPQFFAELRQAAEPNLMLKDPNQIEDLSGIGRELQRTGFTAPPNTGSGTAPAPMKP